MYPGVIFNLLLVCPTFPSIEMLVEFDRECFHKEVTLISFHLAWRCWGSEQQRVPLTKWEVGRGLLL